MRRIGFYSLAGLVLILTAFLVFDIPKLIADIGDQTTLGWDYTNKKDTWRVDSSGNLIPGTTNNVNIGSSGLKVKDIHTAGAVNIDGAITLNGAVTLGDNIADIVTVTGKVAGATPLSFDGATANTVYTIFAITDPTTASKTVTFVDATGTVMLSSLATNAPDVANSVTGGTNQLILEGATADAFETFITPTDATADRTITLPDNTGTVTLTTNNLSVFAATTSAQLAGVINDETGSGVVVLATSPSLVTPALGAATATSIALGGGTAITKIVVYSQVIDPASVAANTTAEQTFTVTGLTTADKVIVNKPTNTAGLGIVNARASAADTIAITFGNFTAAAIDAASETYAIVAIRN